MNNINPNLRIPKYYQENYVIAKDNTTELIILALILIFFVGFWVVIVFYAKDKKTANPSTKNLASTYSSNGKNYGTIQAYDTCPVGQCPTNIYTGEKRCPANPSLQMLYDPTIEECNPFNSCSGDTTKYGVLFDGSTSLDGSCDPGVPCRCIDTLYTPSYIQSIFNVTNGSILQSNPQNVDKWYLVQTPTTATGQGSTVPVAYTDPTSQFYQINSGLLNVVQSTVCANLYANQEVGVELSINNTLQCINSNPCLQGSLAYVLPYNNAGQNSYSSTTNYSSFDLINDFNSVPLSCVPNIIENSSKIPGTFNQCYNFQAPVFNFISGQIYCMNPYADIYYNILPYGPSGSLKVQNLLTLVSTNTNLIPDSTLKNNKINNYDLYTGDNITMSVTITPLSYLYIDQGSSEPLPSDFGNLKCQVNFVEVFPDGSVSNPPIQSDLPYSTIIIGPHSDIYHKYTYQGFNSTSGGTSLSYKDNGIYAFEIKNYSNDSSTTPSLQSSITVITDLASITVSKSTRP